MNIGRRALLAMLLSAGLPVSLARSQSARRPVQRLKIRLALSGGIAEGLGYRIAKAFNYFEDENLEVDEQRVELRTLARDTVIAGRADITNVGVTTMVRAVELGQPLRVVGGITGVNPIYMVVSAPFLKKINVTKEAFRALTPQQRIKLLLSHKARFSSSNPGSLIDLVALQQLKFLGVDTEKDISIHYFPGPTSAIESLSQGDLADVVATSENYGARLARLVQAQSFADLPALLTFDELRSLLPSSLLPGENWIANIRTADEEALTRFIRAYLRGANFFLTKPQAETVSILQRQNPDVISPQARQALADAVDFYVRTTPGDGRLKDEEIKAAIDFSVAQGHIKRRLERSQVVDDRFVDAAHKTLLTK